MKETARCIRYEGIVIWQNSRLLNKPFALPQTVTTARWWLYIQLYICLSARAYMHRDHLSAP